MCGFVGGINVDKAILDRLRDVPHRGPDGSGSLSEGPLLLRHFRLAIIGSSHDAYQPMESLDGNVVLAFNGEIYNYRELAKDMGRPELAQNGDTRVLAELLSQGWRKALPCLNGMFAFVAYYRDTGALVLVRDRLGIKPLYYARAGEGLVFGSEIKALRDAVGAFLCPDAVRNYLDWAVYPSGSSTFYTNIFQLGQGCVLDIPANGTDKDIAEKPYYDLSRTVAELQDAGGLSVDGYEDLLADSIRLRLRSDVPVSLHFSGGTDSTALLVKTHEVWGKDYPLDTFTMAFGEKAYDESRFTKDYCTELGVDNRTCTLSSCEVPELAAELHAFQDEPYGGVPTLSYLKMNRMEREAGYIVSIEGQGGDETFGGYTAHAFMAMYDLVLDGGEAELLNALFHAYGTDEQSVRRIAQRLVESGFSAHTDLTDMRRGAGRGVEKFRSWLLSIQMHDSLVNKIPRTLRFNDRASMACGREVRFPLLDHRVLAYGLAFSHAMKFQGGLGKAPLRSIIRRRLPSVGDVPKRSVVTPQTLWFKGALADWAGERIAVAREAGIIHEADMARIEDFYNDPDPGNSFFVWQVVNLSFFVEDGLWKGAVR